MSNVYRVVSDLTRFLGWEGVCRLLVISCHFISASSIFHPASSFRHYTSLPALSFSSLYSLFHRGRGYSPSKSNVFPVLTARSAHIRTHPTAPLLLLNHIPIMPYLSLLLFTSAFFTLFYSKKPLTTHMPQTNESPHFIPISYRTHTHTHNYGESRRDDARWAVRTVGDEQEPEPERTQEREHEEDGKKPPQKRSAE